MLCTKTPKKQRHTSHHTQSKSPFVTLSHHPTKKLTHLHRDARNIRASIRYDTTQTPALCEKRQKNGPYITPIATLHSPSSQIPPFSSQSLPTHLYPYKQRQPSTLSLPHNLQHRPPKQCHLPTHFPRTFSTTTKGSPNMSAEEQKVVAEVVETAAATTTPEDDAKKLLREQKKAEAAQKKAAAAQKKAEAAAQAEKSKKAADSLGIDTKKSEDFSKWYQQLVVKTGLIDYGDISGCYILRPYAYEIWERIQAFMDAEFKKLGVKNCYFPMFVPKKNLEKEKDHVEGFSAEVAWVTHSGSTPLEEPIAVRPTSETIMYPAFAKWIKSHRDLPMRLNQWCNVVRWEFKDPTPFIRSREFLWQEGHTAHAGYESAAKEVLQILDIYARTYEEILACSVVKGKKTEFEKFAGGLYTTTVEGYIPGTGRGIQAATSHCLGQNFSKMFDVTFQDDTADAEVKHVWQNSWGFTTRSIGVMIMTHSDDKGLVLPPAIAPTQAVFVPIYKGDNVEKVNDAVHKLADELRAKGIRVEVDTREHVRPGFKYNEYELKGVPLRIEIGERDLENNTAIVVRRDLGKKESLSTLNIGQQVEDLLNTMQNDLRTKAKSQHMDAIQQVTKWEDFMSALAKDQLGLLPWCGETSCEESIKKQSAIDSAKNEDATKTGAAKSLCIPFKQPEQDITQECCIKCDKQAAHWVLFGRSY